jgi:hypothetical protein
MSVFDMWQSKPVNTIRTITLANNEGPEITTVTMVLVSAEGSNTTANDMLIH